ncbi:MAG: nickel pincer cofactor biosynthesis protein LarB [Candidatus Thorarchaeota archaeon]|nr:nickel pincer cofactor biosynthesis protein LarB [Candidatus Thorarchaeota archaeon]
MLEDLVSGRISTEEAERLIRARDAERLGEFAVLDLQRQERTGVPEVILAEWKDESHLVSIAETVVKRNGFALLTRVSRSKRDRILEELSHLRYEVSGSGDHLTMLLHSSDWSPPQRAGRIAVMTAGTSDKPYADEVKATAEVMGVEVVTFRDVGVAGIHRLLEPLATIAKMDVDALVVLAGMEGALPTVVASLVDLPVIGLPVPTGYGLGGKGKTALASMLQSCVPGLAVVNIGNGVGAGALAALIAKRCARYRKREDQSQTSQC